MVSKTDVRNNHGANHDAGALAVTLFDPHHKILVIGVDAAVLATRKYLLLRAGYLVKTCSGDHTAMAMLAQEDFDMVVLGPSYPPEGYQQLEDRVRTAHPQALIVKIQRLTRDRGRSPDCFVESDSPAELLECVAVLFDEPMRVVAVISPTARAKHARLQATALRKISNALLQVGSEQRERGLVFLTEDGKRRRKTKGAVASC